MSSTAAVDAASESATHLGDSGHAPSTVSNAPSPSVPASNDLTPAPEAAASHSKLQSYPNHATTPHLSDHLSNDEDDAANVAAQYGTRSRNRPGRARPNYADDKEIDLEIEAAGKYPKVPKRSSAVNAAVPAPSQDMDVRNGFAAINGNNAAPSAVPPPVSNGSHAAMPSSAASKKRKQPGSNVTVPAQPTPPPPSISKPAIGSRTQSLDTNVMSFRRCQAYLNHKQQLVADDNTTIAVNDHLYFICEPPGEPYYFGRIMEFLHYHNDPKNHVEAVRVNWFYRPKDIQRRVQDTRVVFASMHSDTCPLASMRGKCYVRHLNDIPDLDEFRKQPDAFWFDKLYDRYMHRYYEVVPTSKVVNVPRRVKNVLDERWKFVLVEVGRGRDLTSASKVCKRCTDFAANHESVDCAVCKNTYHMSCVRPPLLKKPARGFAWACAACSRAQELKMEARHTPMSENELSRLAEAESFDEEEEGSQPHDQTNQTTRESSVGGEAHAEPTAAQLAQANLWPWRYLGIHARPEDALDIDDRIYPRASSRLGPRHQANVTVWHGRPLEFIKAAEGKKKYKPVGGNKKDAKAVALLENDKRPKRPKWVFDEPPGFVARGQDEPIELKGKKEYTAQLIFRMPDSSKFTERGLVDDLRPDDYGDIVDNFLMRCDKEIAPKYGLQAGNVDVRTKGLEKLQENHYDVTKAFEAMQRLTAKTDLKLPELTKEEIKRFEEGVAKYGSELHLVARHVSSTIKESRIVRFYYTWKKTERGRQIWGSYEGRKSKKDSKKVEKDSNGAKLFEDVADDGDDSAFDEDKATKVKRGFKCKFCSAISSRFWRRAPATAPGTLVPRDPAAKSAKDKSGWLVSALCGKCAYLWRRYAVQYEPIEEIGKKIAVAGGRASKRKVDEELMRIVLEAQIAAGDIISKNTAQIATTAGIEVPLTLVESDEPAKKKTKPDGPVEGTEIVVEKKRIVPEKPPELEPLQPEPPRVKEHPCAVCHIINHPEHKMLKCRDCRLHVHAPCYGINNFPVGGAWYCDMCKNDHNTQVSTNYECVLCPIRRTPQELMEPPKASHKKKTDREREKERAEREMVQEAGRRWREDQLASGRPVDPREPLKRTAWNNWVHVNCAVWTKEIRFGDADRLDDAEGIGFISLERFAAPCKFCNEINYPTVQCQFPACNINFHVGCAHQRKLTFGFDISPVKMSRRDSVPVMRLDQESGLAVPGIWCAQHHVPTIVHNMLEQTPSGLTALQEFVRTYKQVDSNVTGTVRRAAQFQANAPILTSTGQPIHRKVATVNGHGHQPILIETLAGQTARSPSPLTRVNGDGHQQQAIVTRVKSEKKCCNCSAQSSPKWWKVDVDSSLKADGPESQQTQRQPSETTSLRASNSVQPPSPLLQQHQQPLQASQHIQAHDSLASMQVKPEPMDVDTMEVPAETLYQCHKCHINKKTPPTPPSPTRRQPPAPSGPAQEARPQVPVESHLSQGPADSPLHGHSHLRAGSAASQMYPTNTQTVWSGPTIRNGIGPGPHATVVYTHPPLAYHRPGDIGYPFSPAVHYGSQSSLPLPGTRPNGLPQHSPPPGPYLHPSQPSSALVSGQPGSPRILQANGAAAYPPRSIDSPNIGYGTLRHPLPPQPQTLSRGLSQSLSHVVQTATDQLGHARRLSQETTPRMVASRLDVPSESPRTMHLNREDTPRMLDREQEGQRSTTGLPGASASPNLKNLLS